MTLECIHQTKSAISIPFYDRKGTKRKKNVRTFELWGVGPTCCYCSSCTSTVLHGWVDTGQWVFDRSMWRQASYKKQHHCCWVGRQDDQVHGQVCYRSMYRHNTMPEGIALTSEGHACPCTNCVDNRRLERKRSHPARCWPASPRQYYRSALQQNARYWILLIYLSNKIWQLCVRQRLGSILS